MLTTNYYYFTFKDFYSISHDIETFILSMPTSVEFNGNNVVFYFINFE